MAVGKSDSGTPAPPARARGGRRAVAIGLTGGIGAGKSTALAMFAELGARTISADRIVHDLYASPTFAARLAERFGPEIKDAQGAVDRRRLAAAVRGRRDDLRWLEELTHPLVGEEVRRFVAEAPAGSVVVCEVPLLFESGGRYTEMFDVVVTVEAARENRVGRSAHRFHPEAFSEFERLQATTEQRVAGSHHAFYNDRDPEALRSFVREVYAEASALASAAGR